ncbi:glycosyltransferase [Haliangium sp.]|uniref:glycosyltransferase n=1 Tax=Haliangium sp. TaxID=2663208 RepID=UPI003D0BBDA0
MVEPPGDRVAVFDLDGVLVDLPIARERVRARIEQIAADLGVGGSFRPLLASLERAQQTLAGRDPEAAQALRDRAWAVIDDEERIAAERAVARPGAARLLELLSRPGARVPMALYTNNHISAARRALAVAGLSPDRFFAVEARRGPASLKPAGEPLVRIAQAAPSPPARLFFVGDHPYDVEAAVRAQTLLGTDTTVVPLALRSDRVADADLDRPGVGLLIDRLSDAYAFITAAPAPCSVAVVLLAYDEEDAIADAIADARRFLSLYARGHQIVVVDDGSRDRTAARADACANDCDGSDLVLVRHPKNQGMGASMRDGYRAATADYLAHLPADRQVRPAALIRFWPYLDPARPRRVILSSYERAPSGPARLLMSAGFRILVRYLGGYRVDFAGTYLFHRGLLDRVDPARTPSSSFLYSFQLLEAMRRRGAEFVRVRISPFAREFGTSREATARRIGRLAVEVARARLATRG